MKNRTRADRRERSFASSFLPASRVRSRIFREMQRLTSFSEDISRAGYVPGSKTLGWRIVRDRRIAALLRQKSVLRLKRLRLADGKPLCIEETYLPPKHRALLSEGNLSASLYRLLAKAGHKLVRSQELMLIRLPTSEERRLFRMSAKTPVVQITRLAFDRRGAAVEFTRNVLRADRYLFYIELATSNESRAARKKSPTRNSSLVASL